MDDIELAHWRYREKAIPRDIDALTEILRRGRSLKVEMEVQFRRASAAGGVIPDDLRSDALAKVERDLADVQAQIETNRYLLEEARYKAELPVMYYAELSPDAPGEEEEKKMSEFESQARVQYPKRTHPHHPVHELALQLAVSNLLPNDTSDTIVYRAEKFAKFLSEDS